GPGVALADRGGLVVRGPRAGGEVLAAARRPPGRPAGERAAGGPGHRLHPVRRPPRPGAVRPDRGGPHRRRPHLRRRGRRRRSAGPRLLIRLFAPLKKHRRSPLGCSRKRAVRFSPFGIWLSGMRKVFGMSGPPSWM